MGQGTIVPGHFDVDLVVYSESKTYRRIIICIHVHTYVRIYTELAMFCM